MKRLLLAAACMAALGSTAVAHSIRFHTNCLTARYCITSIYTVEPGGASAKVYDVPAELDEGRAARIEQWETFCKPKLMVDANGVGRYGYAHEGCDTGRRE